MPAGPVRIGGFGGAAGLAAYLRAEAITGIVDATHPFAAAISANAAAAAAQTGLPLLVLRRPPWPAEPSWQTVPDITAAAAAVRAWPGDSVFLTTGRRDLGAFAGDAGHRFLARAVDPPDPGGPVPPRLTLVLDRGPYTVEGEAALMHAHGVGLLVTKNSGGPMTAAKLAGRPRAGGTGRRGGAPAAAARQHVRDHGGRGASVARPGSRPVLLGNARRARRWPCALRRSRWRLRR